MQLDKLFRLRMYAEVRFGFSDASDQTELEDSIRKIFTAHEITMETKDDVLVREKKGVADVWEARIKPPRYYFAVESCTSYEHFVELLQQNLQKLSVLISPREVLIIGVQGYFWYGLNSVQDFFQVASSWSSSYQELPSRDLSVNISDIGVNVYFREEALKISIACKFLKKKESQEFFPGEWRKINKEMGLLIDLNIATDSPLEFQKSLSPGMVAAIRSRINEALAEMEHKITRAAGLP